MTAGGTAPRPGRDPAPRPAPGLWSSPGTAAPAADIVHDGGRPAAGSGGRRIPTAAMVVVYLAALGAFVGIVTVRGGPSVGDAYGVTKPATALADGDLARRRQGLGTPPTPGVRAASPRLWSSSSVRCSGRRNGATDAWRR